MKKIDYIAPYLPYDLQVVNKHDHMPTPLLVATTAKVGRNGINPIAVVHIDMYLPLLIPMEDALQGVHINSIAEWMQSNPDTAHPTMEEALMWLDIALSHDILELPYRLVNELIKRHFDVFGLIPQGLAISKY